MLPSVARLRIWRALAHGDIPGQPIPASVWKRRGFEGCVLRTLHLAGAFVTTPPTRSTSNRDSRLKSPRPRLLLACFRRCSLTRASGASWRKATVESSAAIVWMTTGGVALLPAYAQNFLTRSVTSRPLKGDTPTVQLVLGYKKSNDSPILKLLLSRLDELVARVSKKTH
jgi:hypothetical protein